MIQFVLRGNSSCGIITYCFAFQFSLFTIQKFLLKTCDISRRALGWSMICLGLLFFHFAAQVYFIWITIDIIFTLGCENHDKIFYTIFSFDGISCLSYKKRYRLTCVFARLICFKPCVKFSNFVAIFTVPINIENVVFQREIEG